MVIDSVNGGFLTGAEIVIESGRPNLRTDSLGRFEVDDMAAVEVYQNNAPVEYARPGVSCITTLLWTRWRVHT